MAKIARGQYVGQCANRDMCAPAYANRPASGYQSGVRRIASGD